LRKKGLSAASKKTTRVAAEGLLAVAKGPASAAVVEINSETDFVARNDIFQHLVVTLSLCFFTFYGLGFSHFGV
jgi:translation elongation factor EF-Ts